MSEVIRYLAVIVLFVGLAMYLFLEQPKGQEVGRIMFWTGLLSVLIALAMGR